MLDTIKRQKLFFFSLAGIAVVSLILMTSFAYQSTRVDYDDKSNTSLKVDSGVLDVLFKSTEYINNLNMPLSKDYTNSGYSEFTIDNSNSTSDVAFYIELIELDYMESLKTEDFKYTLTEVVNGIEKVVGEGDFSYLSGDSIRLLFGDSNYLNINKSEIKKYRLYLWLKETEFNQNDLENAYFKGKIKITSVFKSDVYENTLKHNIIANATNNENPLYATLKDSSTVSLLGDTSNVSELVKVDGDSEPAYYFRGNVENNYVNFANMCFRVVKLESDGSIKLVLQSKDNTCENIVSDYVVSEDTFGYVSLDGKTIANVENIREVLTNFENKLGNNVTKLKNGSWCYNSESYKDELGNTNESTIGDNEALYYEDYVNLNKNIVKNNCSNSLDGYASLLTLEDVLLAGVSTNASKSYLDGNANYLLLSKAFYKNGVDYTYIVKNNKIDTLSVMEIGNYRPVIRLINGIQISSGNGTIEEPYVVD